MHRTLWTVAVMVAAGIAPGVASQTPPDFSGQWTVEAPSAKPAGPGAAAVRGDLGSGWGTTIAITQDAKQLVVEPMVYSRYDLQPQPRLVYSLDGSETRNTLVLGRGFQVLASRARWEGTSLTITTVHTFADPESGKPSTIEVTQTLSLESPSTLVVEARRSGVLGGSPSSTRTVYTKG